MGKYKMSMSKQDMMGEGTSSICRKGVCMETGTEVAIKVYKALKETHKGEDVRLQKFRRQISVLKMLQEPFGTVSDETLWHPQLAATKPSKLFMSLLDYSKDKSGTPAPDPTDGVMYVITELAQYSLKDYLALRRDQGKSLSRGAVKNISKAIILVVAGLHAKGLVHLDLKPENLMMFNGRLKLIDVDGCVPCGSEVSIQDSSISFSPCYCAPEWARFLIEETESKITVRPHLDVWSVGMTICELATLDAVLKPMYANFLRNGHSHREAGFLFMDWLGSIAKAPIPKSIERFDPTFHQMLIGSLLVCDHTKRKTLAQCLSDSYLESDKEKVANHTSAVEHSHSEAPPLPVHEKVDRTTRNRIEDTSSKAPLYKGTLWKLNTDGNPQDPTHWLKRDMWVAFNGSLCYFSIKENKRLVLVDGSKLTGAKVTPLVGAAREYAFRLQCYNHDEHEKDVNIGFSAESPEEYTKWTGLLMHTANMDGAIQTMRLGGDVAAEIKQFRLNVKNRRMKVGEDKKDQFAPVFKAKLWKVKADGDRRKQEDWFEREMWIAKNGSLVYWSKKEDRDLVYYTSDDIARATITLIPNDDSFIPWAFQVHLPPIGEVEFTPGEFAAESEAMRDCWIEELKERVAEPR
ncbi:PHKG2 [Symbiodinium natans]|uniref:PHKG2 protein n=1 Tax=Symbiodinium natans TaxID=878477 RepID=A0A812M5F5_9DINO|nr:PHKG2 [Symbiodinium natans]